MSGPGSSSRVANRSTGTHNCSTVPSLGHGDDPRLPPTGLTPPCDHDGRQRRGERVPRVDPGPHVRLGHSLSLPQTTDPDRQSVRMASAVCSSWPVWPTRVARGRTTAPIAVPHRPRTGCRVRVETGVILINREWLALTVKERDGGDEPTLLVDLKRARQNVVARRLRMWLHGPHLVVGPEAEVAPLRRLGSVRRTDPRAEHFHRSNGGGVPCPRQ